METDRQINRKEEKKREENHVLHMQTDTRMTNSIFYIIMLFYINGEKKKERDWGD